MSKPLIFYTNPMSRGQIVRWVLEEAGVNYQQEIIEYGAQMKSPEYLSINPMGKVPAIKHADTIITECAAICAYIADAFPAAELAPPVDARAAYYRWLFFAAGPLESAVVNKSLGFDVTEEQQPRAGYGNYELTVHTLDQHFENKQYVCGDNFSAADVYVGAQVDWGIMFNTIPATDSLLAYAERLRVRPAYEKAKAIDAALIAQQQS